MISLWWSVHDSLKGISLERLKVHLTDLDDDLQCNEVNDAVFNSVLVGQEININAFAKN